MRSRVGAIRLLTLFVIVAAISVAFGGYRAWHSSKYPYGRTHACDKLLNFMLMQHADTHNGWYPAGEATPEASLSLLYRSDPSIGYLLAGKSSSIEEAESILAAGKLLTPNTCSWHYVEGLRSSDNPNLALFWDRVGLGHHGERMPEGGHNVYFVDGRHRWVSAEEWPTFLEEQEKLLPNRPGISPRALEQR